MATAPRTTPITATHALNVHDLLVQVLATQAKANIILRSILNELAKMPHEHNKDGVSIRKYGGTD